MAEVNRPLVDGRSPALYLCGLAPTGPSRHALDRANGPADEPLRFLRITVGILLLLGSGLAVALALSGIAPRALELVAMFWAIYGFIMGLTSGVMEPVIEGAAHVLANFGLVRIGGGYSAIESLVARGEIAAAAEAYRERAQRPAERVEATVRRAALLAGPMGHPETALIELSADRRLGDPGRAMAELRRLIDGHPGSRSVRRLRHALAELKAEHLESQ